MADDNSMTRVVREDGSEGLIPAGAAQQLLREYQARGGRFSTISRRVHSTRPFVFELSDRRPVAAPSQLTYRLVTKNTSFFSYGQNGPLDLGLSTGVSRPATAADTSLTAPRETPNKDDMAIGAVAFRVRSVRVEYSNASIESAVAASGAGSLSQQLDGMLRGTVPTVDPASLVTPPQFASPFNLTRPFEELLRPFVVLDFSWQGKVRYYQGLAVQMPSAAASSYLAAFGAPANENVFGVPEGYIWRRPGAEQDNELEVIARVDHDLVVQCNPPAAPLLGGTYVEAPAPVPERLILDVSMELFCIAFGATSGNNG